MSCPPAARALGPLLGVLVLLGAGGARGAEPARSAHAAPAAEAGPGATRDAVSRPGAGLRVRGPVGYARIEGPIDRLRYRYLERVVADARKRGLDALVVHLDTDGGEVYYAREMFQIVLRQAHGGPRMIAYVDRRALSAGAMIAYAHEAIYVAPTASIGDIGVIFVKPGGEIAYAPEKIETVVRTLLTQAAEERGWDRGLLLKMIARNQKLYRIHEPGGATRYVIEDDLPDYLSRHPEIDRTDPRQVIVYRGEDRLLTLTGREALSLGMATGEASDLGALYRTLGVDPKKVVDLSPAPTEVAAWFLSRIGPLLAGLAILFVLFELKTPGVGLWAALGALFGALFLISNHALDLVNNLEIVLMVLGAGLLILELVTGFGGGLLALAGGGVLLAGLLLSFLPDELGFNPADPRFRAALEHAFVESLYTLGVVTAGVVAFLVLVPRSRAAARVSLRAQLPDAPAPAPAGGRVAAHRGVARDALRPGGTVIVDGATYSARAEHGAYIEAGSPVLVVGSEFGELVVRAAPAEPARE